MKRTTRAIALSTVDYSDTSQIVSFLTRDVGLLDGIAKGAHRTRNPFEGPFDLAVHYEIGFIARRSSGLAIITEAEVLDGFRGLRGSWSRHVAASQTIEFLRGVSVAGEPTPELFDLAVVILDGLSTAAESLLAWILLGFEARALRLLGFLADIDSCVMCGRPRPGAGAAFFSPIGGGLVCRGCRGGAAAASGRIATLSGAAVAALRELCETDASEYGVGRPDFSAGGAARTRRTSVEGENPAPALPSVAVLRQLHGCVSRSVAALLDRPLRMLRYRAAWL